MEVEVNGVTETRKLVKRDWEGYVVPLRISGMSIDGVKIDFAEHWVHLRKSNTEPIIRIYSEAATEVRAEELARQVMNNI